MARIRGDRHAFGWPGIEPRWTQGGKEGIGTAYSATSHLWFTLWNGAVTEVYYPTIDRPHIRDIQYLITDGESFFHEEKRHLHTEMRRISDHALAYEIVNHDPAGRYRITKEVITSEIKTYIIYNLVGCACVLLAENDLLQSTTLLSAASAMADSIGFKIEPEIEKPYATTLAALKEKMHSDAFSAAWESGKKMTSDQAVETALRGQI